ncbi:aminotransferase class V-fold PLP-dependent enzyme [bacterium]|nr:aminotransferase class V-fold PLP-dependent enzyme [bacterium]
MTVNLAHEFPILEKMNFLNHAAVSPLPRRAGEIIKQYASEAMEQGSDAWPVWWGRIQEARARAARLLGAGEDEIAFCHNTTHGLMCVANSLPWRPGDNIVTAAGEFPANVHPWRNLATRGVAVRTIAERPDRTFSAEDFAAAIDGRTRLIAISLVQYGTGCLMPIEAIAELCKKHGILLCLDGIQAIGAMPANVAEIGCDFMSADGHKWLMGPEGAGVLYVKRERLNILNDSMTGWIGRVRPLDFTDFDQPLAAGAVRFEEGSHNAVSIGALGESMGLINEVGIEEIWRRIEALTARIEEGASRLGFEIVSPRGDGFRSGIIAITKPGLDVDACAKALAERKIYVAARRGWMRLSPHFYNKMEQIEEFLEAIEQS